MKSISGMAFAFLLFSFLAIGCSHEPIRKTRGGGSSNSYEENIPTRPSSSPTQNNSINSVSASDAIKSAQSYYSKSDYNKAMSALDAVPEASVAPANRTEYQNLKGLVQLAQKKPVQAEVSFRKALDTNTTPEYRGYYQYNLASALSESGRKNDSLEILSSIDLAKLDTAQQHKVLVLKERLSAPGYANLPTNSKGNVIIPGAQPSPTAFPIPTEVYSGPVNRFRIGLLIPLSGKYEAFGKKVQRAVELAFQHSTESRAKDFEIISVDSGETLESRTEAMKKLVEQDQVIAIIGPVLSKGIEELAARAAYYQVPLISMAQATNANTSHLFACSVSTHDQAAQMAEYAMKVKGYSRFAILAPSNNAGKEMASAFSSEVQSRQGEIKTLEMYDPEITDFRIPVDKTIGLFNTAARSKELREMAEKRKELKITKKTMKTNQYFELPPIVDFDAVFIADEAKTVGQIIPTFAYRNAKGLQYLGITSWNSNQLIQRAQEQAEGATFPVAFNTLSPPAPTKNFYDLYVATYGAYPGELDALAFDAAAIAIRAAKSSPSNRDDFRLALEGAKDVEGATGEVSITDHRCERKLALYTVQKGKFVAVGETEKR